jgi:hypothetical protein
MKMRFHTGRVAAILAVLVVSAVGVLAQSTQVAPHVREVNSELIHELLESMDALLDSINGSLAQDATHDAAAPNTGPLVHGECDDTSTDAVDEGDGGKSRIDCTSRALFTRTVDPCSAEAKTYYVVDVADGTNTEIANAVAGEFVYVCSVNLVAAGATTVLISEDDTDGCGSPSAGLHGGSTGTTTEGWSFAANGGIALGNGQGTVMKTATANRYFCIDQSASVQLSGTIAYVSAP